MHFPVAGHDSMRISDGFVQIPQPFTINVGHDAARFINDGVRRACIPDVRVIPGMNIEVGALLENQPNLQADAAALNRLRDAQRFTDLFNP